jgi:hypothetical protein
VQHKIREREFSSRATKERRKEKERKAATSNPAALCSNERWELSGCDPPLCVVFFLYF